jgi:hypothetical protein
LCRKGPIRIKTSKDRWRGKAAIEVSVRIVELARKEIALAGTP